MTRSLIAALMVAFMAPPLGAADRPHVVVFLADDLGYADCPPAGGTAPPTPNMIRLARAGMAFTQACVASPSCAPSRAALLTGVDPARNGSMLNHAAPRKDVRAWPAYFAALGYETAAVGKVAHYAQVKQYGFDHASHFNYHQDDCVEAAVKWLAGRASDKPLCLLVGTNWPHVPWPEKGWGDGGRAALGPRLVDTPETRAAVARYRAAVANADRDLGLVYDAARKALGDNVLFAFTSDHGAQFPGGKWNLYDAGVRTPLVVAWPGHVKPGTASDALVTWTDLLPTFLEAAGGTPPAVGTGKGEVSGRSFLAVLKGDAKEHREHQFLTHSGDGAMNRYPMRGVRTRGWKYVRNLDPDAEYHSHVDLGRNPKGDGREYWDSWVEKAKSDPSAAGAIKAYHTRPPEELYDLAADPAEARNLAADPAHAETLKKFRATLDGWMKANGDDGLKTERGLQAAPPRAGGK
ncbi:heparan n-sulfatase : N-acetylgalactosamine 6-sulfatase (GALNS) OS=Blastopirellula marina DSM 3645 GN=DSM3645_02158 PE=4 SV=1: Sulfatase [Gemmataceae bacterium]|nr:heparan n-sulfatase : N-acetylgalactosamine 6-sulfatase (GALNS) OS=Blastopirellula marina DSM 3645 GN=DSM3645_02158 PE=4 SV=1: Sulfatase [Gemmataceae bacterium]VTT99790.1 heparan n-sulfatase : N-acetylgalactosamine 6-sulfatase (GALNS) OS=Blastopirellula marina DSM 3645 GN=DSM3645_02158 PE=4 SV=1: Sulfatase [Gemmataceae bacterium]